MEEHSTQEKSPSYVPEAGKSTVRLAVGGMTCVACVQSITEALSELEGVSDISVNRVRKSASAIVTGSNLVESIVTVIEDIGFECTVVSLIPVVAVGASTGKRSVAVEFKGMQSVLVPRPPSNLCCDLKHGSDLSRLDQQRSKISYWRNLNPTYPSRSAVQAILPTSFALNISLLPLILQSER